MLAYSTIAQYGYIVTMFGLGGKAGVLGRCSPSLRTGWARARLFLTAGTVTEATDGASLAKQAACAAPCRSWRLPAALAASLAAIPLTMGFFKDEYFRSRRAPWPRRRAIGRGRVDDLLPSGAVLVGIFGGPEIGAPRPVSFTLVAPIAALGALSPSAASGPNRSPGLHPAGQVALQRDDALHPAYHLQWTIENGMAIAAPLASGWCLTRRIWFDTVEVAGALLARALVRNGSTAGVLNSTICPTDSLDRSARPAQPRGHGAGSRRR
ncbi:MAG: proton-conducting transporter membrane subunit [Thermomicrobiales bacterium]